MYIIQAKEMSWATGAVRNLLILICTDVIIQAKEVSWVGELVRDRNVTEAVRNLWTLVCTGVYYSG